ncbi:hypothetical protein UPYG_G00350710 [Umbra pygmaea]|uniref:Uncharacterized protein n=1 Tax=Umbra pygmaea TaxID=75934 RepID=A0ABD0WCV3_UMBPY
MSAENQRGAANKYQTAANDPLAITREVQGAVLPPSVAQEPRPNRVVHSETKFKFIGLFNHPTRAPQDKVTTRL